MLEQTRLSPSTDAAAGLHAKRPESLGDLPDLLLVERTRGRDMRAFETLMRRYNRRLYRIARSILSDDGLAEEAVRSTHVRAVANLDRYEPAGKFGSWLARLAFSEALATRRHPLGVALAQRVDGNGAAAPYAGPESSQTDASLSRREIENAIDGLPEVFRTVLVLRVIEELSGVEVAVCLGLNETTVRTRLYRAQQRLKADAVRSLRADPYGIFELPAERGDRIVAQVFTRLHTAAPAVEPK